MNIPAENSQAAGATNATRHPSALITGGAGFIGSHLAGLLLTRGWNVRIFDSLCTGKLANVPKLEGRVEFISGDVRDSGAVRRACTGVDTVFHLAAQVSVMESVRNPQLNDEVNIGGTANVYEGAAAAGVRRVVFSSSCAIYGDDPILPKTENLPTAPASPYAASKLAGEVLGAKAADHGLSVVSLRYFNVYGPRQDPASDYAAVVPLFIKLGLGRQIPTIYGDGEQTRDFIFVGDIARANLQASIIPLPPGRGPVFNAGTGEATSVNRLWRRISALTGFSEAPKHAAARAGEVRHSRACPQLAREVLGFAAASSLEEGLAATVRSFPRP